MHANACMAAGLKNSWLQGLKCMAKLRRVVAAISMNNQMLGTPDARFGRSKMGVHTLDLTLC